VVEGQQGDFGGAVEADWKADGSEAGVGVERQRTYGVRSANIFSG